MGDYACQAQSILPISLLDDMLKKNEQKKHQNITRTVLVGKSVNGPIKIAAFQSKITAVEKTLSRANARDSTVLGLLSLIYEQCFLLVIESSCEKSIAFIQELESALTDFHSLRILCSNDAQPTQLLSHIVHQKVSGKNEETEIEKGELNTQVIELCQKLFKVMKSAGEKKDQVRSVCASTRNHFIHTSTIENQCKIHPIGRTKEKDDLPYSWFGPCTV